MPPRRSRIPLLEFDSDPRGVIEPREVIKPARVPTRCIFTWFGEVIRELRRRGARVVARSGSEDGPNPVWAIRFRGRPLAVMHAGVGGAKAGGFLDEAIAHGCRKFIAVGGAGSLRRDLLHGALVIPTAAIRDEGLSYHYLPASREVRPDPQAVRALEATLRRHGIPYRLGKTWTTDAIFRETRGKVKRRAAEGCLTVEMEAASMMAVAKFRRVPFGQLLYRGDDVSGTEWDRKGMGARGHGGRMRLFELAAEACLRL